MSSGAVGVGSQQLKLENRPSTVAQKQACAAIGQLHLMRYYSDFFASLQMVHLQGRRDRRLRDVCVQKCGQILLTNDTFTNQSHFLNTRNTVLEMIAYNIVPIINENVIQADKSQKMSERHLGYCGGR